MVNTKEKIYVLEVDGIARDCCTEAYLYRNYLKDFKKCDVEIFQIGDTFVLNNINNTVGFAYPITD